jgi:hypothetical protein
MPLAKNTAELRTADMGLLPNTTYYYSVFTVTAIDPVTNLGYTSEPLSIEVTTTGEVVADPSTNPTSNYIPNLVANSTFANATNLTIPGWEVSGANSLTSLFSVTSSGGGDAVTELAGENINGFLRVTLPPSGSNPVVLSQVINPKGEGLVPGKLYSLSVWIRTNNPLTTADIIKGGDTTYFPTIGIFGGSPDVQILAFQEDQSIANEDPLGTYNQPGRPCAFSDSTTCQRTLNIGGSSNPMTAAYAYGNPAWINIWQRITVSFVIGSPLPSTVLNAYNGGDPVQTPMAKVANFDTITLQFQFKSNEKDNPVAGIIDLANPVIVEGLIPFTDPFWKIPAMPNPNLVYNPIFDGLYTPTAGSVAPFWEFDSSVNPAPNVCEGSTICFYDPKDKRYNNQSPPKFCNLFTPNSAIDSYIALTACSQPTSVTQGNIFGSTPSMFSSFTLAPTTYTMTFSYAVQNGVTANDLNLTFNILDISKGAEVSLTVDGLTIDGAFHSKSITFECPSRLNPQIQFSLNVPSGAVASSVTVAISHIVLSPSKDPNLVETYGIQSPYPVLSAVPYTTFAEKDKHAIVWKFPPKSSDSVTKQLFNETAYRLDGTQLDSSQGMTLLSAYHELCVDLPPGKNINNKGINVAAGVDIVTDTDSDLKAILGASTGNVLAITKANSINNNGTPYFANASAFLQSNGYYGSGRWDMWVKLASITTYAGKSFSGPGSVYNPTGTSIAMWIYHALDLSVAGGAPSMLYAQSLLNSEIDIEIGGACPDYSQNYGYNIARLNGWGGQWGCSSDCTNNFTMHTQMPATTKFPNGVNIDDGYYHKLSIVFHSGTDILPTSADPNGIYPGTRQPGFIKWFVDDVEWGCGWTGNSYGYDYVPMTNTRLVFGPEATDWAGSCLCYDTPGVCNGCHDNPAPMQPSGSTICKPPSEANCFCGTCANQSDVTPHQSAYDAYAPSYAKNGYCPPCNDWSTATINIAKIQFTPTCLDCPLPTNPNYYPDVTLPARPDPTKGATLPPSNRNRALPETKPYEVFPTT